jgi:hypothetical protein
MPLQALHIFNDSHEITHTVPPAVAIKNVSTYSIATGKSPSLPIIF